jgi:flavin reductase
MSDALVIFDCRLTNRLIVGSHHVLFGAVEDISLVKEGRPLLYSNRLYGGFMPCDGPNVSHAPLLQKASASAR